MYCQQKIEEKYTLCVQEVPNKCPKLNIVYMIDDKFVSCLRNVVRYGCRSVRHKRLHDRSTHAT